VKYKTIAALFKRQILITIINATDKKGNVNQQYVAAGDAIYPLFGFPVVDPPQLAATFDYDQKNARFKNF